MVYGELYFAHLPAMKGGLVKVEGRLVDPKLQEM